jgi:hypothetical protein
LASADHNRLALDRSAAGVKFRDFFDTPDNQLRGLREGI